MSQSQDDRSVMIPKMAKILLLRGLGYSQSEIATRISVSQQTVSYYLKLMKSKAESTSPEEYFRSFIPYFSDKVPAKIEKKKLDLGDVRYQIGEGVEVNKITLAVDDMTKFKKEISEQLKKDRIEMDSIMKSFEEENRKGVKILADELTRLSELMNNSDVNRRR